MFVNISMFADAERVMRFYESIDAVNIICRLLEEEDMYDELLKVTLQLLARVLSLG